MPAFWGYPPPPHDYPYHWVILDPKSKEDKVKVTNLKNSPKFLIFEFWNGHYMQHTFSICLIRCANMKWIWWVLLKIQSGHDSVHRWTDGQTEKVKPVYPPFNFVEAGGIMRFFGNNLMVISQVMFNISNWNVFNYWNVSGNCSFQIKWHLPGAAVLNQSCMHMLVTYVDPSGTRMYAICMRPLKWCDSSVIYYEGWCIWFHLYYTFTCWSTDCLGKQRKWQHQNVTLLDLCVSSSF